MTVHALAPPERMSCGARVTLCGGAWGFGSAETYNTMSRTAFKAVEAAQLERVTCRRCWRAWRVAGRA